MEERLNENRRKIIRSESNEISRLRKMQNRSSGSGYFLVLLMLIAVVNILDEVTSNLTVTVQSPFVTEFFVNNPFMGKYYTYEDGLAFHSGIGVFTYVLGLFTPFYKALADKWGRKPLFAISTLGMAIGLLVIIGLVVGYATTVIGMTFMPIWTACLVVSIPTVTVAAILFTAKVKETKGVNLDAIE